MALSVVVIYTYIALNIYLHSVFLYPAVLNRMIRGFG
jgi:hypothetical protein